MTRVILLENLKTFTWEATRDLIMPVAPSEEEPEPKPRAGGSAGIEGQLTLGGVGGNGEEQASNDRERQHPDGSSCNSVH